MNLGKKNKIYFLGIGGIGMSALARWFNTNGYKVAGYDRSATALTDELMKEGIKIHFEDDINKISDEFKVKEETLVVLTPAIPSDHTELNFYKQHNFEIRKRSEVLGMITKEMYTIAIAGTHGKTTTSSMIAHMVKSAGLDCAAFLGGITVNYNTNLLLNKNKASESMVVVEADEYDRSFLRLSPDIAVITAMDPDHLDIYADSNDFKKTFNDFVKQIKPSGHLFYRDNVGSDIDATIKVNKNSFGTKAGEFTASNIRIDNGDFVCDAKGPGIDIKELRLSVPGYHNIENALAAMAVGAKLGISSEKIKKALGDFKGVKRRFEYIVKADKIIYIDDYAHHPTEIEAFLTSVKALYKGKRLTVIFQPHLYTRTRDFLDGFAKSLSLGDKLLLMDIYPARELPIPGITSELVLEKVNLNDKKVVTKKDLLKEVGNTETDIIVTMGAGDIDQFILPIKNLLLKQYA
ncbi:MAG: UDP-N-acetylmuramate--L-alanine ligase [Cytophagaceae bacterium]|nr:UDP-N-acetylmuramate--L-alanine ligase [Cytophagaceae bacterium]